MPPAFSPRAQRFPLQLPLQYRPIGVAGWFGGATENISHSGVLFRGDRHVRVNTPVEIALVLPSGLLGEWGGRVVCTARIVRLVPAPTDETTAGLAAAITNYRIVPRGEADRDLPSDSRTADGQATPGNKEGPANNH